MPPPRARSAPPSAPRAPGDDPSTQDRILVAAEELFCARGYEGVSARDVAARAGAHKALVFYYFGSMAGLFEAVLERYYEAHRSALAGALAGGGDVRERMHRLVDAYLEFMASHARYATLVQAQLSNPATHPLVEKSYRPLFRFVEDALLEIAPPEGRAAARQLFVTFSGAVINWCTYAPLLSRVLGSDPLGPPLLDERREHVRWLVDLVLDALEAPGASPQRAPARAVGHARGAPAPSQPGETGRPRRGRAGAPRAGRAPK